MKIEKIRVLKEFSHMDQYCDECGTKMILKNKSTIIKEDFVGDFILKGFHPICQKCGEEFLTSKMLAELKRMMKARIQELLLKNYSPEVYHYIPIEEIALLEKCSVDDLLNSSEYKFPVLHIIIDNKRFYLEKSYKLYKANNLSGWFDITSPEK